MTLTGGTIQAGVTVSDTGTVASTSVGFRGAPVRTITSGALLASDNGKTVSATGTVTYDEDDLPEGFVCKIYNRNASGMVTIQCSDGTQYHEGSADSIVRLGARREATLSRPGNAEFVIEGGGLTA